jgi:hypothetical protein
VYRQDLIKREIEQLALALASIALRRKSGDYERASEELKGAYRALGIDASYTLLDGRSLALILGSGSKLGALADVLEEDAALDEARADFASATRKRALAGELLAARDRTGGA